MGYYCNECEHDITDAEAEYSYSHFHKYLCRDCQDDYRTSPARARPAQRISLASPEPTPEALKLREALIAEGIPIRRRDMEKFDGKKHIDISISSAMLNLEVDGAHHNFDKRQALADLKRTYYSFKKGWITLRIPNSLVRDDATLRETARYIKRIISASMDQLEEEDW